MVDHELAGMIEFFMAGEGLCVLCEQLKNVSRESNIWNTPLASCQCEPITNKQNQGMYVYKLYQKHT